MAITGKEFQMDPLVAAFLGGNKNGLFGSSETTKSPQSEQLFDMLLPKITGTQQADAVVQNIIKRASVDFAPSLAMERSAGLYSSTARNQLASEALARAVGESSKAVLDSQSDAARTAAIAAGNNKKMQAAGALGQNPLMNIGMMIAAGYGLDAAKGGMKKLKDSLKSPGLGNSIADAMDMNSGASAAAEGAKTAAAETAAETATSGAGAPVAEAMGAGMSEAEIASMVSGADAANIFGALYSSDALGYAASALGLESSVAGLSAEVAAGLEAFGIGALSAEAAAGLEAFGIGTAIAEGAGAEFGLGELLVAFLF